MESGDSAPSVDTEASTPFQPSGNNLAKEPLWNYVTVLQKFSGGTKLWKCSFCNNDYRGSIGRVKAHLLRWVGQGIVVCESITAEMQCQLQKEQDEAAKKFTSKNEIPAPPPSGKRKHTSSSENNTIEKCFNNNARAQVDSTIAKMFYSAGLPFNLARNPYFVDSYRQCANSKIVGYSPPSYDSLRTTLLAQEKATIERNLDGIKKSWRTKGLSIVSDGWSDSQRRPLINFIAVSESGPMFLKAVNCEGEYKDKFFIANLIREVILEVGPQHVVQVVTDNAPVCKAAGAIIEGWFPHIFWTPCVVHTLNLALKNICAAKNTEANEIVYEECHWITEVADRALQIKNFVMNHQKRMAMYNKFAPLKLLSVADTRFASVLIMLKRFKLMKRAFEAMVLDDEWSSYREDDHVKAAHVRSTILDELWWDKVDYILEFTAPIYDMLRKADTDKPCLHLVYDMWDSMIEKVKSIIYKHEKDDPFAASSFYEVVHSILVDRWNKSSTPLHCLAHSLNPRYYSDEWLSESSDHLSPDEDHEISEERNKCFRRLCGDNDEARKALVLEYAHFSGSMGAFASPEAMSDRGTYEPKIWWATYGSSAPNLKRLATKVLGQPCSSSCAERNWSTYSFIHSLRRNKLLPSRAEMLVYVHNNLRLLSRQKEEYNQGQTKQWDIGGDRFDSFEGVNQLQIAELTLDEPELETFIIEENATDATQG